MKSDEMNGSLEIAAIAIGKLYNSWALAMIETIRKHGQYQGPIHVITDLPQNFRKFENVTAIVPQKGVNPKLYKTMLFEYIDADTILYIDVDVVVAKPLQPFFAEVQKVISDYAILVFEDTGMAKVPYHAGVIIFNRNRSNDLLSQWRATMVDEDCQCDQVVLNHVANHQNVYILPAKYLLFPDDTTLKNQDTRTFVHITFTGRQVVYDMQLIRNYLKNTLHVTNVPFNCSQFNVSIKRAKEVVRKFVHRR